MTRSPPRGGAGAHAAQAVKALIDSVEAGKPTHSLRLRRRATVHGARLEPANGLWQIRSGSVDFSIPEHPFTGDVRSELFSLCTGNSMRSLQRSIKGHLAAATRRQPLLRRRVIKLSLLLTSLGMFNLASSPALAQQAGKPATQEDVLTYAFMGSVNLCTLAQAKVAFQPALQGAIGMQVAVLSQKHGGKITGVQNEKALTEQELANGSAIQTVMQVNAMCGKNLPPDWSKEVNDMVSKIQNLKKGGAPATPPK